MGIIMYNRNQQLLSSERLKHKKGKSSFSLRAAVALAIVLSSCGGGNFSNMGSTDRLYFLSIVIQIDS